MRKHFLIGIIGVAQGPAPTESADFVVSWEPKILIAIKYCPFCGKQIDVVKEQLRTA